MRFGNALFWKKIFIYNLNQNLSDRPIFFNLHSILDQVWCLCFGFEISVRFLNHVCVERCQWYKKFYKLMGNITIIICSKYTYHRSMGCLHTVENEIPTFPCWWCLVSACYFFLRFCVSITFLYNLYFSWYSHHHNRISSQPYIIIVKEMEILVCNSYQLFWASGTDLLIPGSHLYCKLDSLIKVLI